MSVDLKPTCPAVKRFLDDLKLNGKSTRTQQSYCRAVRKFAEYLGHSPEQATEDQLPVVLSIGEVYTLLKLIEKPSMRLVDNG